MNREKFKNMGTIRGDAVEESKMVLSMRFLRRAVSNGLRKEGRSFGGGDGAAGEDSSHHERERN